MKITGPGESSLLLLKVIRHLDKLNIPYAVVGAFAASFYGIVRASLDADAVISMDDNDPKLDHLLDLLKNENFKTTLRKGGAGDPIRCVINIEDEFKNRVDLLMGIRGMNEGVYERAITASFMNREIKIVGVEDLVAMKIYAGSTKDIEDAIGILKVSMKKINMPLLKQITRQYGKKEPAKLEKILNTI